MEDQAVTFNKELFKLKLDLFLDALYQEIKHGDEEHQKWLLDKITEFKNQYNSK